jgi:hypothetical protein
LSKGGNLLVAPRELGKSLDRCVLQAFAKVADFAVSIGQPKALAARASWAVAKARTLGFVSGTAAGMASLEK